MVLVHLRMHVFQFMYTVVLMTNEMAPPFTSIIVFSQPEKQAPQSHINTLIYNRPAAPTQHGGRVTTTLPVQAVYTAGRIFIQFSVLF